MVDFKQLLKEKQAEDKIMAGGWNKQDSGGELSFFKFDTPGDELIGKWRGTKKNTKYPDRVNGVLLTKDDGLQVFTLSAALEGLVDYELGTFVKLVFLGKESLKSGNSFNQFDIFTWDPEKDKDDPVTEHASPVNIPSGGEPFKATDDDVPF